MVHSDSSITYCRNEKKIISYKKVTTQRTNEPPAFRFRVIRFADRQLSSIERAALFFRSIGARPTLFSELLQQPEIPQGIFQLLHIK